MKEIEIKGVGLKFLKGLALISRMRERMSGKTSTNTKLEALLVHALPHHEGTSRASKCRDQKIVFGNQTGPRAQSMLGLT